MCCSPARLGGLGPFPSHSAHCSSCLLTGPAADSALRGAPRRRLLFGFPFGAELPQFCCCQCLHCWLLHLLQGGVGERAAAPWRLPGFHLRDAPALIQPRLSSAIPIALPTMPGAPAQAMPTSRTPSTSSCLDSHFSSLCTQLPAGHWCHLHPSYLAAPAVCTEQSAFIRALSRGADCKQNPGQPQPASV